MFKHKIFDKSPNNHYLLSIIISQEFLYNLHQAFENPNYPYIPKQHQSLALLNYKS